MNEVGNPPMGFRSIVWKHWRLMVLLLVSALVLNFGLGLTLGLSRPMGSDAHYYLQAASSLAEGQGYRIRDTYWPDSPAMSRSPGWPFVVSLALRFAPASSPDLIMRCLALALNSLVAVLVFLLARRLFGRPWVAFLAGTGYAVHPVALYLAYDGDSEPLFVLLLVGGVLCILGRRGKGDSDAPHPQRLSSGFRFPSFAPSTWLRASAGRQVSGFLLLGLACLVRPNFLLWGAFFVLLLVLMKGRATMNPLTSILSLKGRGSRLGCPTESHLPSRWHSVSCLILAVFLFLLPSFLWAVRNYRVCGHFPVLSTLRGQTFYGGNNAVTAHEFKYWGYWVFPDAIPGEKPLAELARTMTEYEVDDYYYSKGRQYIRENLQTMPRLLLGKLVRAYLPVPWNLTAGTAVVSVYRWGLYIAALIGVFRFWKKVEESYQLILPAMILTNVATVLLFWGCARFAFPLDPFLLPFAAAGLGSMAQRAGSRCWVAGPGVSG